MRPPPPCQSSRAGQGNSIEGKRRLDFRQLQPRRLLLLDLLCGSRNLLNASCGSVARAKNFRQI
jgi:hypothetical protein